MVRISKLALLFSTALPAAACVAAAAGAGAAGAVYATTRGAQSLVEAPVDEVAGRAEAVMGELQIVKDAESSKQSGEQRELKGKKGDLDVTIQMERQGPTTTKVEVTARKNEVEWDKKYAEEVLTRIVQKQ
jgi:hypothetical protein